MALVLKAISWCLDGDERHGSIYCRKNYDESIWPQWQVKNPPESMEGVFVPECIIDIRLTATLENTGEDNVDAILSVREITSDTKILGDVNFPVARFNAKEMITVNATVNSATMRDFWNMKRRHKQTTTWEWTYTKAIGGDPIPLGKTQHTIYLLPQLPAANPGLWRTGQEPFDVNEKKYIWTELLDVCNEACDQYAKKHTETPKSDHQYLEAFVEELNGNSLFHYDVWSGASAYFRFGSSDTDGVIKLKKYLHDRGTNFTHYLNCSDCAIIIATQALAYGISAYVGIMKDGGNKGFGCNPIIAIGCSAWEIPFGTGFSYHAVTVLDDTCNKDTKVYDACLHLDGGEFPARLTPEGKSPLLPIDLTFAETDIQTVNVPVDQAYTKVYYRERLVANGENCKFEDKAISVEDITPVLTVSQRCTMPTFKGIETENPLPITDQPVWQKRLPPELFQELGSWELTEEYGRYRVYFLTGKDGAHVQVSFWAALDRDEAWSLLQTHICGISAALEKREFSDAAYGIGQHFLLFVCSNLIVELNGYGMDIQTIAQKLERLLRTA